MADLKIRLQNVNLIIEGDLPKEARDEIQSTCSFIIPNFKYLAKYKQEQKRVEREKKEFGFIKKPAWDGTITLAKREYKGNAVLRCPTGLFSYVREVLDNHKLEYVIRDERIAVVTTSGYSTPSLKLRQYQEEIVKKGLKACRGVMKCSTGAGKTELIISMATRAAVFPFLYYVTSCDLLEQAYDRFRKYILYNGNQADIGRVGGGHFDIKPITIMTVQSAQRALVGNFTKNNFDDYCPDDKTKFSEDQYKQIAEIIKEAQFVYVDECHHVSCETIQDILNASYKAKLRIGGSASPWRDDGMDIMIEAAFGRRFCDIDASFLINQGYLIKPYITFNHFNCALGPAADWHAHYSTYVVNNDKRNEWIADRARHHVERNRPTIILVKWVQHAEILKDMLNIDSEILTSSGKHKKSAIKRKDVLERMRKRELMCIIGTTLLDEGVDVPAAGAGIFAGGGKSSTRELQRVGRFIRRDENDPDKNAAYIEEFYDHTRWLGHHARMRRKILSLEKEFEVGDKRII